MAGVLDPLAVVLLAARQDVLDLLDRIANGEEPDPETERIRVRALIDQGAAIVGRLSTAGITAEWDDEIIAMIAYLQRLGVEGSAELEGGGQ